MSDTPICKTHNVPMVHRQGFAKATGKPYDFWSCSVKEGGVFCKEKVSVKLELPITPRPVADDKSAVFMKLVMEKLNVLEDIVRDIRSRQD